MSMLPMFKRCSRCGHRYTYNPSVGDLGLFCPKCGGSDGISGEDERDDGKTIFDALKDLFDHDQRRS